MSQSRLVIGHGRSISLLFDISLFIYLIAYFVYYQDEGINGTIRLIATIMVLASGFILCLQRLRTLNIYTIWYFLFIILSFSSVLWAKDDTLVTGVLPSMLRVLLITILVAARVREEKDIERILTMYLITIIILDVVILQKMLSYYSWLLLLVKRFGDNFNYNSNTTAMLNAMAFLICIHKKINGKTKIAKSFAILLSIIYTIVVFLTESKKGLLGILLGILLFTYYRVKGVKRFRNIVIGLVGILIVFVLIMNVPFLYNIIGYRFESMNQVLFSGNSVDGSTQYRVEMVEQGLEMFADHPILGVGLNNFTAYQTIRAAGYYAHNNYIEVLSDLGIVGFLLYYYMPFKIARVKVNTHDNLQVLMKTLVLLTFFFDIGVVTYQDIRVHFFLLLAFILFFLLPNCPTTKKNYNNAI